MKEETIRWYFPAIQCEAVVVFVSKDSGDQSVFPNAYFIDEKDGKWYVMIRDARPVQEEGGSVQEQVLCFLLSRRGGGGKTVAGYR